MQGTQIQAVVSEYSLKASFKKKLTTGKVYMFTDYNVAQAADTYRAISGEYIINFNRKTKVLGLNDIPMIPRYKFEITTFEAARSREGDVVNLMGNYINLFSYVNMFFNTSAMYTCCSSIPSIMNLYYTQQT